MADQAAGAAAGAAAKRLGIGRTVFYRAFGQEWTGKITKVLPAFYEVKTSDGYKDTVHMSKVRTKK